MIVLGAVEDLSQPPALGLCGWYIREVISADTVRDSIQKFITSHSVREIRTFWYGQSEAKIVKIGLSWGVPPGLPSSPLRLLCPETAAALHPAGTADEISDLAESLKMALPLVIQPVRRCVKLCKDNGCS